jgi:hypothetical protein
MILPRLLVLTALTSTFMPGLALAADSTSTSLARAMRSDEIAVAAAKRAFLTGALEERFGPMQASCVRKVRHAEFTAGSARVIDSVLSPSEIDTALGFFQSPAGTQYVEGLIRRLRAREGEDSQLPKVPAKEVIEPAAVAAIADFSRSDLGRKIMGKQMTESPAALAFGQDIMSAIASRCAAK